MKEDSLKQERKKKNKKLIVAIVLCFLANAMFFLTIYLLDAYDKVCIDQFLFQLKSSSEGVYRALAGSVVVRVGLFTVIATVVQVLICRKYLTSWRHGFIKRKPWVFPLVGLILGISFFVSKLDIIAYAATATKDSDFIEQYYVDPKQVDLVFPEEKRNLIYIFLESMENTFAEMEEEQDCTVNYIPHLTELAQENINFSNTDGIGGARSFAGTTWTASAMVSQTSGVPVKISLLADAYGAEDTFLPGVTAIGEILEEAGYQQTLLVGSDAEFHGREPYFTQHGHYNIVDTVSLKEAGRLAQDYREWWGFEDEKLFTYAKEELLRLAESEQPFNLTMLTADTHFPDGYECRLCEDRYESQYGNVLTCSSKQVYEFILWIQEQPFYENTTIIISGDHLTMDAEFLDEIDPDYVRTIYNCFINVPETPVVEKNRQFAAFDMFPTTLAALGVEIPGNRLALGTNLFSDEKTLTELYGFEELDRELQKNSEFYKQNILEMK